MAIQRYLRILISSTVIASEKIFRKSFFVNDGQGSLECRSPWGCKELTWLSDWTELIISKHFRTYISKWKKYLDTYIIFSFCVMLCNLLEKAMARHSSTLAWKIPRTEEPGRLQTIGSRRVRHDIATSLSLFPFMHWRRKWHPTPVFLPGESQGRGSLVGCRLWGHTESDTTKAT